MRFTECPSSYKKNWEDAHLTDIMARCYNILTNLVLLKIIISHWKLEVVHQASSSIILKV